MINTPLNRYAQVALASLSVVLTVAAAGKLHLAAAAFHRLDSVETVTGLSIRQFLVWSGAAELILATLLLTPIKITLKINLSACLACGILAFRMVKIVLGDRSSCHCMGSISELLGVSDAAIQSLSYGLAFGIIGLWLWLHLSLMRAARSRSNSV